MNTNAAFWFTIISLNILGIVALVLALTSGS